MTPATRADGNVIHAEFGKPRTLSLEIRLKVDVLYHDENVVLTRVTYVLDGRPGRADHFLLAANA